MFPERTGDMVVVFLKSPIEFWPKKEDQPKTLSWPRPQAQYHILTCPSKSDPKIKHSFRRLLLFPSPGLEKERKKILLEYCFPSSVYLFRVFRRSIDYRIRYIADQSFTFEVWFVRPWFLSLHIYNNYLDYLFYSIHVVRI